MTITSQSLGDFFQNLDACEDKRGLTHGLHPYPAKFIPHIPREVIRHFSKPGEVVLDPMCGSGTTVVEALAAGRFGIGSDINPISSLVTRAKTQFLDGEAKAQVCDLLEALASGALPTGPVPEFRNREHWFSDDVAETLAGLTERVAALSSVEAATLARCAFSAIVVGVSRQDSETRWVRTEKDISRAEVVARFRRQLSKHLIRSEELHVGGKVDALTLNADARRLPLARGSVDLIVTSPPYANSHDYYLYNKLRLFWLGYDVRPVQEAEFGSRNKHSDKKLSIDHYFDAMHGVFREMARVLRPGGHTCVVVGDAVIRGEFFNMGSELPRFAEKEGLTLADHHRFRQQRYTRAFTRGFGTAVDKSTHVLIFRSPH